jgi:hypothetical protein
VKTKKDARWIFVVSLVLFFATVSGMLLSFYVPSYPYRENAWWYPLKTATAIFLLLSMTLSALYTADVGKEKLYYAMIIDFIIAVALFIVLFATGPYQSVS